MILTDQFVYLHFPKTGGTFVTSMLARLYEGRSSIAKRWISRKRASGWAGRKYKRLVDRGAYGYLDVLKHGTCREIPESHRDKPVIACVRNPYDRQVSQYEFRWWARFPDSLGDPDVLRQKMPHFPDLSFDDYMELVRTEFRPDLENPSDPEERRAGMQTKQIVDGFFHEPERVLKELDDDYIGRGAWREDMIDVRFLHTDNLNRELHDTLVDFGFEPAETAFILESEKVLPPEGGRRPEQTWERYYSPETKRRFRESERLLFAMFPEFDEGPALDRT